MAWSLIYHDEEPSPDTIGVSLTAAALDAADFAILLVANFDYTTNVDLFGDNHGNTWGTPVTQATAATNVRQTISWAKNANFVGAATTLFFSDNHAPSPVANYPSMCGMAFSGSNLTDPTDQQNMAFDNTSTATSLQPGSITPSEDNCLIVATLVFQADTVISVDSGMTIYQQDYQAGINFGSAIAWKVQTSAAAINPTFSWGSVSNAAAAVFSFKASPSTGGRASGLATLGAG